MFDARRLAAIPAGRRTKWVVLLAWVAIFVHAAWLVWLTLRGAAQADRSVPLAVSGERHGAEWYSRAADRAAAEGRLAEALQLAFVALALTLEGQGHNVDPAVLAPALVEFFEA